MASTLQTQSTSRQGGLHAAIIMDGNGRWAAARGRPRLFGHRAGASALERVVEAAPGLGIRILTVYAFSSDNWRRPIEEVQALMGLFQRYLVERTRDCVAKGLRVSVIGRRDRLPEPLVRTIEAVERTTAAGNALHLRIAVDYSARDSILAAARKVTKKGSISRDDFSRLIGRQMHSPEPSPDVDLLIRTGGEKRLSDFLLWESAYAELIFTSTMWPDFEASHLEAAVVEFESRQRRFGGLPQAAAS